MFSTGAGLMASGAVGKSQVMVTGRSNLVDLSVTTLLRHGQLAGGLDLSPRQAVALKVARGQSQRDQARRRAPGKGIPVSDNGGNAPAGYALQVVEKMTGTCRNTSRRYCNI